MPTEPIAPHVRSPAYRRTFLREHVAAELARTDEVLTVQRVVDKLEGPNRPVSARERLGLLDRFFFREESGARTDLPLALRPVEPKEGAWSDRDEWNLFVIVPSHEGGEFGKGVVDRRPMP